MTRSENGTRDPKLHHLPDSLDRDFLPCKGSRGQALSRFTGETLRGARGWSAVMGEFHHVQC